MLSEDKNRPNFSHQEPEASTRKSSPAAQDIWRKFRETIERYRMLDEKSAVVVGVSGGPDSVALLDMLLRLRERSGMRLCVAHLNHGLRGAESDEEARFVASLSRRWRLNFFSRTIDLRELARCRKIGLEEAGRMARYDFFADVARKFGANRIALGHHADDNAETVMFNLLRGTGLRGLGGIAPVRPLQEGSDVLVVRPLIRITRAEILRYIERHALPYRFDSSNASLSFTRNRIRHELIPELELRYNRALRPVLCHLAEAAREAQKIIELEAAQNVSSLDLHKSAREARLSCAWLRDMPELVAIEVIRQIARQLFGRTIFLCQGHLEALRGLIYKSRGCGILRMPGDLVAAREHGELILRKSARKLLLSPACPTELDVPGSTDLCPFGGVMHAAVRDGGVNELLTFRETKTPDEEIFDYEKLVFPLAVRTWREGDRFHPLGAPGLQKLQDFMTDHRIPREKRRCIPIVTMKDHPIWLVGFRIDERVKVTQATKRLLHLRFVRAPADE